MRAQATSQTNEHWTAIGRRLVSENEGRSKLEKAAHLREAAHTMGFAPHTLGRFVVLAQLLDRMNVSPQQATAFPVGTVELIARIYDRDRVKAEQIVKNFDRKKFTYSATYSILRGLGGDSRGSLTPGDDINRVRLLIKEHAFADAEVQEVDLVAKSEKFMFKADSLWRYKGIVAAFISETYHAYSTDRGLKNIYVSAILCSAEHDFVVIEFIDDKSRTDFLRLVDKLKPDIRVRIKDGGISTREVSP